LLYLPWTLFIRSRQQALNTPAFKKPLHYRLTDEGIEVSQDDTTEQMGWDGMVKAVSTTNSIIVYTTKTNACIFPKKDLGDKKYKVIEIISTHMPPGKVKIRG
ncbi:MAG: YcxB family protein, partial [Lachnospiraceae bacterium]|nr:YcxB family protein [Lachnospiraceae bacterium]